MADNVALTAGDGSIIGATDTIGSGPGVAYPLVKVVWGPLDTINVTDVASGKSIPVQLRGSAGGDVVKLEDDGSANLDPGMPVLAVRKATAANTSGSDGDYEFLQMSAGALWVASAATDKTLLAQRTINGGAEYETVAASQTAQALGPTGAMGDYISHILVIPASTSPGNVLLLDNAISITVFAGGASSVSNLVPFSIPLGMISVSGAWKITTGANVSCIGVGNFT